MGRWTVGWGDVNGKKCWKSVGSEEGGLLKGMRCLGQKLTLGNGLVDVRYVVVVLSTVMGGCVGLGAVLKTGGRILVVVQ